MKRCLSWVTYTLVATFVALHVAALEAADFRGRGTNRTSGSTSGKRSSDIRRVAAQEPLDPESDPRAPGLRPELPPQPELERDPPVVPRAEVIDDEPETLPATPKKPNATRPRTQTQPAPQVERSYAPPTTSDWNESWVDDPSMSAGDCSDGSCGPEMFGYGHRPCFGHGSWGGIEYLLWNRKGRRVPPLVTTATTAQDRLDADGSISDGRIDKATTRTLLGDDQLGSRMLPGGRIDFGLWLDSCQSQGVGFRFFALADDDLNYNITSAANNVLTVPFQNVNPLVAREDALVVAHPLDGTTGNINVRGHQASLAGDVYLRFKGVRTCDYDLDLVGGYFFSRVDEDLSLTTNTNNAGNVITFNDSFRTKNEYHGGSIGLLGSFDREVWRVTMLAKVALANVNETMIVDGSQTIAGALQDPRAGLFAQPSNIGTFRRNEFAAIPEFNMNMNYKLCRNLEATVGYSFVYWSRTLRPGEQMSRRIDPINGNNNVQAVNEPTSAFRVTDYWAQGTNFGLTWSY